MEFLYISPEFPPNYAGFILQLNKVGINVWAMGEADFYEMPEKLRSALKWYERTDLNSLPAVNAACDALLEAKKRLGTYARFDLVESHNEQWLRLEAHLNQRCGIDGIRPVDLDRLKKKSEMKKRFQECGLPVARGARIDDPDHGLRLAGELGYPLILKPDEGVGAGGIHKVLDEDHLRILLSEAQGDCVLEEYIDAPIVTYDGLTDRDGNLRFENSLAYGDGVLDYVLGKEPFFYVSRKIPPRLAEIGRRLVASFGIRRKFFHFEFFHTDGRYVPIEINCRPPGGPILDMMNYSVDQDLYAAYARMIDGQDPKVDVEKKFFCSYIGRRNRGYALDHSEILARFGGFLVEHGENPTIFSDAMGGYRYIFRSPSKDELLEIAADVLRQREG